MLCRELESEEIFKANEFYKLTNYSRIVSSAERVFVAESDGEILGAVCIENKEQINVLRGMYVLPQLIGKKIGSNLLKFIEPFLSEADAFCIPYRHLEGFYSKVGFSVASENTTPEFLMERLQGYLDKQSDVIVMYRSKKVAPERVRKSPLVDYDVQVSKIDR